ncbi:hypothetical protein ENUP19_0009G0035 [Entamoeba nuttalli]|uniref:Uncharacterized protein n=2 Tax=Entamoeba nuttalli TaxID=412467 RepID=K2HM63_ENTNP|nr:hypothetical protein ENU1_214840 [Entamoeba nuttalli P19]EKE36895.1 hypothetical protein ENU1_214840 [Entamoeba nuttalli P19]|eukprot:XP_008860760.1 hypothetical protein ENU1_214840 [Entamoeba nuttalli P19]
MIAIFFTLYFSCFGKILICGETVVREDQSITYVNFKQYQYDTCMNENGQYLKVNKNNNIYEIKYYDKDCNVQQGDSAELSNCTEVDQLPDYNITISLFSQTEECNELETSVKQYILLDTCHNKTKYIRDGTTVSWKRYVDDDCTVNNPVFISYKIKCNICNTNNQFTNGKAMVKCVLPENEYICGKKNINNERQVFTTFTTGLCVRNGESSSYKYYNEIDNDAIVIKLNSYSDSSDCSTVPTITKPNIEDCEIGSLNEYDGYLIAQMENECSDDQYSEKYYFKTGVCLDKQRYENTKDGLNVITYNEDTCETINKKTTFKCMSCDEANKQVIHCEEVKQVFCSHKNSNNQVNEVEPFWVNACNPSSNGLYEKVILKDQKYNVYRYSSMYCNGTKFLFNTFKEEECFSSYTPLKDVTKKYCLNNICKEGTKDIDIITDICVNKQKYSRGNDKIVLTRYTDEDCTIIANTNQYPNGNVSLSGIDLVIFSYTRGNKIYCGKRDDEGNAGYTIMYYLNECIRRDNNTFIKMELNNKYQITQYDDSGCTLPNSKKQIETFETNECTDKIDNIIATEYSLLNSQCDSITSEEIKLYHSDICIDSIKYQWDKGNLIREKYNDNLCQGTIKESIELECDKCHINNKSPDNTNSIINCTTVIHNDELVICGIRNRDTSAVSSFYQYNLNRCYKTSKKTSLMVFKISNQNHYTIRTFSSSSNCKGGNFNDRLLSNVECKNEEPALSTAFIYYDSTNKKCSNYEKGILVKNIVFATCAERKKYFIGDNELQEFIYTNDECQGTYIQNNYQCNECSSYLEGSIYVHCSYVSNNTISIFSYLLVLLFIMLI